MKYGMAALLITAGASVGFATSNAPFYGQCVSLDRVFEATHTQSPVRYVALDILERIAENRMDGASAEMETQLGFQAGQLHQPDYKAPTVREYAIRKVGEVDLPEALAYLQNLRREEIGPDPTGMLWSAFQIATRQAQLNRIPDDPGRIRFLEDTTGEQSAAASWAVEELCNQGSQRSLGFIQASIRRRNPTPDGEKEIGFCEVKIGVISRNPDLVKALGSVLSVRSGSVDAQLVGWAINQLYTMDSPRADAELARYMDELDQLPNGSPLKRELLSRGIQMHDLLPRRK